MPRKAGAAAPDLAELAAEVARLRARVERLERAQPAAPAAPRRGPLLLKLPKGTGLPAGDAPKVQTAKARRNSALNRAEAAPMIEPPESWNLGPPGLAGRRRTP
jgi:hypothetical protein